MNTDSFESFGVGFQNNVIQGLLTDREFFEKSFETLKDDYFTGDAHKTVWTEVRKLFNKYNTPPTYETLKVEISSLPDNQLKADTIEVLLDIETKVNRQEIEYAKDKSLEFCKNQSMKQAILASVDLLKEGKYEEIQSVIEQSLKINTEQDLGQNYFDSFESRRKVHTRNTIPTGFPLLDEEDILDGGLGSGELGVVMAPTGGGKSFFLVNLGYGALAAGKNVIHYSMELSETHVGNRYDSRITGINTIKFHVGRLLSNGFDPDLIIIDYGDLMKSRRGYEQKRFELESVFEDLRAMSMELKLPIWTATQSNRDGFNDEIITIDKVGEAINKAHVVDFFGTFSQRKFHVGKNRMGSANINFNIEMKPECAHIELNDDQSSGFSASDKLNSLLTGGGDSRSKIGNLYKSYKDGE